MSRSSLESSLSQYREALLQINSQLFLTLKDRRSLSLKIQELKNSRIGTYSHFDPEREVLSFRIMSEHLKLLTIKELLAFSLIMEDQAMAMAPGSYPAWSTKVHVANPSSDFYTMINPLLLKETHPELFKHLTLLVEFSFLKQF
jgi:chorismate mutase